MKEATASPKDVALKLAFEALESADWYINQLEMIVYCVDDDGTHENRAKVQAAITAIKEALVQDELCSSQEPVAGDVHTEHCFQGEYKHCCKYGDGDDCTAAPKTQWISLTDDEFLSIVTWRGPVNNPHFDRLEYAKAIEAKLKEKNT